MRRFARDMALAVAALAAAAFVWAPERPRVALGVVGGGVLVGLSLWAISGVADALVRGAETGQNRPVFPRFVLVKFFTRHAILAFAAYVMMVRLHLDPVGMLVGVASVVVAAAVAAARQR